MPKERIRFQTRKAHLRLERKRNTLSEDENVLLKVRFHLYSVAVVARGAVRLMSGARLIHPFISLFLPGFFLAPDREQRRGGACSAGVWPWGWRRLARLGPSRPSRGKSGAREGRNSGVAQQQQVVEAVADLEDGSHNYSSD